MLNRIRKTIAAYSMLEQGDHVVVAVSGGPDSVALLQVLVLLTNELKLNLRAAHFNHGIRREEADRDEAFVRRLSAGMGIDCVCKKVDIPAMHHAEGRSLEEICRDERYRFLCETAVPCGTVKIAVGHHRDDQAETILHHLFRGSGTAGLRGILPVWEGRIIRPLLEVGRKDILEFLRREGLAYVTDSTNQSSLFLRNRIRNELIPDLASRYNPRLVGCLCQTAGIIRREDDYLQGVVRQILNRWGIGLGCDVVEVPLPEFLNQHEAIQGRIIKFILEGAAPCRNGIGYRHIEAVRILALRHEGRSSSLDLPFPIRVECKKDVLLIKRESNRKARKEIQGEGKSLIHFEYPVEIPSTTYLPEIDRTILVAPIEKPSMEEIRNRPETAFMDYEGMTPPLILRNIRPGDRFEPLGTKGTKKLKDYFIDRKIEAWRRREFPLLVDAGAIIWIAGERISERVRITGKTRRVLKAEVVDGKTSQLSV